jgi:hypothetical protein
MTSFLGCDGLFLDTIDTAAPNFYTSPSDENFSKVREEEIRVEKRREKRKRKRRKRRDEKGRGRDKGN